MNTLIQRMRSESLAVVGLVVALIALGYNTWRNELSEQNTTVRIAGIEMLLKVGELQSTVYLVAFEKDMEPKVRRQGETLVSTLRDLSMFMPETVQDQSGNLIQTWRANWNALDNEDQESVALIDSAINDLRLQIVKEVRRLE